MSWGYVSGVCGVLVISGACQPTPDASSNGRSATGSTSSVPSAETSVAATAASGEPAPVSDQCTALRAAVLEQAGKLASCESDADCAVHRIVLCDFDELDCYAAHVNKSLEVAELDKAVGAYVEKCPVSKCKCEMPTRSVCSSGKCADG